MKLPRRRERDETRVLKDMGKALGWENYNTTAGRATSKGDETTLGGDRLIVPGRGNVSVRGDMTPEKFQGTKGLK